MRAIKGICACAVTLALAGAPVMPVAFADDPASGSSTASEEAEGGSSAGGAGSGTAEGGSSQKGGSSKSSGKSSEKPSDDSKSSKGGSSKSPSKKDASKDSASKGTGLSDAKASSGDSSKQSAKTAKLLSTARSAKDKADAAAGKIAGPRAELESASSSLSSARERLLSLQEKRSAVAEKAEHAEQRSSDVGAVLVSAQYALRSNGVATLASVLPNVMTAQPVEGALPVDEMPGALDDMLDAQLAARVARIGRADLLDAPEAKEGEPASYALERVVDGLGKELAKAQKRQVKLEKRDKKLKKRIKEQAKAQSATIAAGNKNAFAIEKHSSDSRVFDRRAQDAADKLDESDSASASMIERVQASKDNHTTLREEAAEVVGAWYDLVDSFSDRENAISFGEGVDFLMDRDAFVAKWGAAIEKFYEGRVSEEGVNCPLKDYAEYMAGCAYDTVIDPRLCAAVSIIESSGGVYCIRPHNAWGWGAADSDPYNLATEWGSWEEAIKAWHEGVAHSTTGLADAATLDEFGEIYCSSADWSADVAKCMQKISDYANEG